MNYEGSEDFECAMTITTWFAKVLKIIMEENKVNKNVSVENPTKAFTYAGLVFTNTFAGLFFVLLFAWAVVMAAFSVSSAAAGVCLIGGINPYALLPAMPYWCGTVLAFALISLSVLAAVGCTYFTFIVLGLVKAYGCFCHNQLAPFTGKDVLAPLASYPKLSPKINRSLKRIAFISTAVFAVCFASGYIVCSVSAGSLGFWHAWNWFVK